MADEERKDDDEGVTVQLRKPVRVLNETKTELKFREPTAWDIDKIGDPFYYSGNSVMYNPSILISMLCELGGGLPPGTFGKQMKASDLAQCRFAVQSFFMPLAPIMSELTSDSSPSSSPSTSESTPTS